MLPDLRKRSRLAESGSDHSEPRLCCYGRRHEPLTPLTRLCLRQQSECFEAVFPSQLMTHR